MRPNDCGPASVDQIDAHRLGRQTWCLVAKLSNDRLMPTTQIKRRVHFKTAHPDLFPPLWGEKLTRSQGEQNAVGGRDTNLSWRVALCDLALPLLGLTSLHSL